MVAALLKGNEGGSSGNDGEDGSVRSSRDGDVETMQRVLVMTMGGSGRDSSRLAANYGSDGSSDETMRFYKVMRRRKAVVEMVEQWQTAVVEMVEQWQTAVVEVGQALVISRDHPLLFYFLSLIP